MKFTEIETKQMRLTGITPADMQMIFSELLKEEIKKILGHRSEKEFLKEEMKFKKGYASYNKSFVIFLLSDKSNGKIIGRCGFHNWNPDHHRAEMAYVMEDEAYQNKGWMQEAVQAIIAYGFNTLHLNRIEALTATDNVPSVRILLKNKFKKEGLLRQHYFTRKGHEDSVFYALLKSEWFPVDAD